VEKHAVRKKRGNTSGPVGRGAYFWRNRHYYFLLAPGVVYFFIFHYIPMWGVVLAFKDLNWARGILGSPWVGFKHFAYLFGLKDFYQVFWNSLYLSFLRIFFYFPFPILLALMLDELRLVLYKRVVQTVLYLPHFISWIVIGGIFIMFLSPSDGIVNMLLRALGMEPVFFMAKPQYFRPILVLSTIWKEAGWGTILYLAAISQINPELYEAAIIDGAGRFQRIRYVTLPALKTTVVVLLLLRIGRIMTNGFEQVYILQNPLNLVVSEVFETYVYRTGLLETRFELGTAVGLFQSVVGFALLLGADRLAKRLGQRGLY
jgi:putative aldouronate transport system permease protein